MGISDQMIAAGIKPDVSQTPTSQSQGSIADQMQAAGIKPTGVNDGTQPTSTGSKVISAASGFNQGVENVTLGAVQLGSLISDKVLGTNLTPEVGKLKSSLEDAQNQFKDANPGTFCSF